MIKHNRYNNIIISSIIRNLELISPARMHKGDEYKPSQRWQIFIKGKDYASPNGSPFLDTYVEVFQSNQLDTHFKKILKTDVCYSSTSPSYLQTIKVDYFYQSSHVITLGKKNIKLKVYGNGQFLGQTQLLALSSDIYHQSYGKQHNIYNQNKVTGKLILRYQKIKKKLEGRIFEGQIRVMELLDFWKSIPPNYSSKKVFFKIYRTSVKSNNVSHQFELFVSKTKEIRQSIQWQPFKIEQRILCLNNLNTKFEIRFYLKSKLDIQIGSAIFTVNTLECGKLLPLECRQNLKLKPRGKIMFINYLSRQHTFYELLKNGMKIETALCIDFTESNRKYTDASSLHHFSKHSQKMNAYQQVMDCLLQIILEYSCERKVSLLGFGAKVNHSKFKTGENVSHCFPLTLNQDKIYAKTKQSILQIYENCLPYLELAGPTVLTRILSWAVTTIEQYQKSANYDYMKYMVMFILTDGVFDKKEQTYQIFRKCQSLPFSLVIIGVGQDKFQLLKQLNEKPRKVFEQSTQTGRKFLKFIRFEDYRDQGSDGAIKSRAFRDQALRELPSQVEAYAEFIKKYNTNEMSQSL